MIRRLRWCKILFLAFLLFVLGIASAFAAPGENISFNVALRSTGSVRIHAGIYNNPHCKKGNVTVLAVHGLTEVGSMFEPLAKTVFADPTLKNVVKRVVAIDMPAHGLSSAPTLPSPLTFGELLIEDNVGVLISSIAYLCSIGKGPQIVIGHSMGGLALQAAQETLLAKNSSLSKLGVSGAILMAAVPARGTTWTRYPGADVSVYIVQDPKLGTIFKMPVAYCGLSGGFNTLTGAVIAAAPTPQTCIANNWMGPEPMAALTELTGTLAVNPDDQACQGLCRPYVRAGAFAPKNGTTLTVLGFSQDILAPSVDQARLYTYLTGLKSNARNSLYRPVVAADAVHSMFVSNPAGMIGAIRSGIR